jgi:hypothetical protein
MEKQRMLEEPKPARQQQPVHEEQEMQDAERVQPGSSGVAELHRHLGNQAVQRLLAQRSDNGPTELDDETARHIDSARGGGRPLEAAVGEQMSQAMGVDLGGVNVHTSPEADELNQQLGAKAFTTGQDIFFRSGAYDPHSNAGQELIAHELTHVVQQGAGAVKSGPGMTVSVPGDVHEQQADATAHAVTQSGLQRQEEEEELIQPQIEEEEEEEIQPQEIPEEEEVLQMQEEEEEVQMQEEEELQLQEEEEVQMQEEEEEELQMKSEAEEEEEALEP